MNNHFFRGALAVAAISTLHFALQVVLQLPLVISNIISIGTFIGLCLAGGLLWRKHHPWAGGFLAAILGFYVFPWMYLWLVILTGGKLM